MGATPCPSLEVIEALAEGAPGGEAWRPHVESCERCGQELARVRADNAFLSEIASALDGASTRASASGQGAGRPGVVGGATAPGVVSIPGYELLDEVHRGGQGVVYRARQVSAKRLVAVKTLLGGGLSSSRQRARFEREVELVASLRHPGIVTLYESGVGETGEPYLAMELIDGLALSDYVALLPERVGRGRAWAAPIVALFAEIADATAYAHRRGVIHRDLKPGNILVDDDGRPHLLDFGIAKATEKAHETDVATTLAGEFVGTFRYAAPEQVSGEPDAVDTRTDVYALGVLLYESLTGQRTYELKGSIAQVVATITGARVKKPSALNARVDGELDAIVLKALAKEPERRYQSAQAFGDDLRAYLENRPVSARGDTTAYVLVKLARRHRVGLGVGLVIAALVGSIPVLWVGHLLALNRQRINVIEGFMVPMRSADWRTSPHAVRTLDEYFNLVAETIRERFADDPRLLGPAEHYLGVAAFGRSEYAVARAHLERARDLEAGLAPGGGSVTLAAIQHDLGRASWNLGDYERAEGEYGEALRMRRALLPEGSGEIGQTLYHLGATYALMGREDEAIGAYQQAIDILAAAGPEWSETLAAAHNSHAGALQAIGVRFRQQGDEASAVAWLTRSRDQYGLAFELIRESAGVENLRTGSAAHGYAAALAELGQTGEALEMLRLAVEVKSRELGAEHASTLASMALLNRLDGGGVEGPPRAE